MTALGVRRLFIESLESRHLLAAVSAGGDQLAIDTTTVATSILVQYRTGVTTPGSLGAYLLGANTDKQWGLVPGMRIVVPDAGVDLQAALAAFQSDPNVAFAEPNYTIKATADPPNDPYFASEQWDLHNTGQTGGFAGDDIHLLPAWDATKGDPHVIVAVLDSGVDYDHPDLYQNIWINQAEIPPSRTDNLVDVDGDGLITFADLNDPQNQGPFKITDINGDGRIDGADLIAPMDTDFFGQDSGSGGWADGIDSDNNAYTDDFVGYNFVAQTNDPMDDYFHGTHVAGTIAAMADNGIGVAGIAPHVEIMPLKFLDSNGFSQISDAISALNYAVANGATISNNSWGDNNLSQAFETAIQNAAAHDHIFVAAAGNDSSNNDNTPFYPASYPDDNIISVTATDSNDYLASFANTGQQSVDLAAPGVTIFSTLPSVPTQAMIDRGLPNDYGPVSGTSMATPHVTGVVALLRALHPEWTAQQVIQQVLGTVDHLPDLADKTVTGGRLDAARALGQTYGDPTPLSIVSSDPTGTTSGSIGHLRVTFSKPIDPTTFDTNDIVAFTGPHGSIGVFGMQPVPSSDRQYDIYFVPQSDPGNYRMELGPHIIDLYGIAMDQNGDGVPGQDGSDDYVAQFSIVSTTTTFSSANVPITATGMVPVSSVLTVGQDLTIGNVKVNLNLTAPQDGNVSIWVVAPSGVRVQLAYLNGGASSNFANTVFNDNADEPIQLGKAPFTGPFKPDDPLAAFNGQNARGTWRLFIQNVNFAQNVRINSWSLEIARSTGGDTGFHNDPPVPQDDSVKGVQNTPLIVQPGQLLANDTDPNGNHLAIVSVGSPVGGTVVLNPVGNVTFTPAAGVSQASFQYSVSDGIVSASANVAIALSPQFPYHNPRLGSDVDGDGVVAPHDALVLIMYLNGYGATPTQQLGGPSASGNMYYDAFADNVISPKDLTAVISFLNANGAQSLAQSAAASFATAADPSPAAAPAIDALAASTSGEKRAAQPVPGNLVVAAFSLAADAAEMPTDNSGDQTVGRPTPLAPAAVDEVLSSSDGDQSLLDDLRLL